MGRAARPDVTSWRARPNGTRRRSTGLPRTPARSSSSSRETRRSLNSSRSARSGGGASSGTARRASNSVSTRSMSSALAGRRPVRRVRGRAGQGRRGSAGGAGQPCSTPIQRSSPKRAASSRRPLAALQRDRGDDGERSERARRRGGQRGRPDGAGVTTGGVDVERDAGCSRRFEHARAVMERETAEDGSGAAGRLAGRRCGDHVAETRRSPLDVRRHRARRSRKRSLLTIGSSSGRRRASPPMTTSPRPAAR